MSNYWKNSYAEAIEISWTPFEVVLPVNPDKELLHVKLSVVNIEQFPVYFDSLFVLKNLLNDKLNAAETTFIPVQTVSTSTEFTGTVFGAVDVVKIVSVHFIPEQNIVGDNTNSLQLQIVKNGTGDVVASKTFVEETNAMAHTVTDFGPVNSENAILSPRDSLNLNKINLGTGKELPKGILIIRWDIA